MPYADEEVQRAYKKEYNKIIYMLLKESLCEKVTCECGRVVSGQHLREHKRTRVHFIEMKKLKTNP